jgi:hypothetical protein
MLYCQATEGEKDFEQDTRVLGIDGEKCNSFLFNLLVSFDAVGIDKFLRGLRDFR